MIKKLTIPIVSYLCTIFYFMPYMFRTLREPKIVGLLYILAMVWFYFSWTIIIVLVNSIADDLRDHKKIDIFKVISIVSILCFYLIVVSSFRYGTMVTV